MNDPLLYKKAFAKALAAHLRGTVPEYTESRTGSGGCETCGYGASEYDVVQPSQLDRVIEKFAENWRPTS